MEHPLVGSRAERVARWFHAPESVAEADPGSAVRDRADGQFVEMYRYGVEYAGWVVVSPPEVTYRKAGPGDPAERGTQMAVVRAWCEPPAPAEGNNTEGA